MRPASRLLALAYATLLAHGAAEPARGTSPAAPSAALRLRAGSSLVERVAAGGPWRLRGHWALVPETRAGELFADGFETGSVCSWSDATIALDCLPAGAVLFFEATSCPTGWIPLATAAGRAVVGRPLAGSAGSVGSPLADLAEVFHDHTFSATGLTGEQPAHGHPWAKAFNNDWYDGTDLRVVDWSDGIDDAGSGTYPLATEIDVHLHTERSGGHTHTVDWGGTTSPTFNSPPGYLQLLACQKP